MASTGASAKRSEKLTQKSCELCKARKVRCDRKAPSCTWCLRNNRACVYTERRKPGAPSRLELQMEEKVDVLESNLQLLTERLDSYIGRSYDTDNSDTLADRQDSDIAGFGVHSHNLPPSQDPLNSVRHDLTLESRHSATPSVRSADPIPLGYSPGMLDLAYQDAMFEQHQLPPRKVLSCLVDTFFKHIVTWAPLFSRTTIDDILSAPWIAEDDAVVLHGIVLSTIRYSEDSAIYPNDRSQYYHASDQKVKHQALDTVSIRSAQALGLAVLDSLGCSDGPEGRKLLGLLVQCFKLMEVGKEKSFFLELPIDSRRGRFAPMAIKKPVSWLEEEERRRLCWTVYMLDRYATIGTHTSFTYRETDLDLPLPCRYDSFCNNKSSETKWFKGSVVESRGQSEEHGSFTHHCELLAILSQIHTFLEEPFDAESQSAVRFWKNNYILLDNALNGWLSSLPEHASISQLCHQNPAARVSNWMMLQAAYILSIIRLNSAAAYPLRETQHFQHSKNARQRCLAAVDSLRRITMDMTQAGALQCLGYPYAFVLWICAGVLLVHAAAAGLKVDPTIWFFISALESQARCWPVASHYAETLRKVLHLGERQFYANGRPWRYGKPHTHRHEEVCLSVRSTCKQRRKLTSWINRRAYELNDLRLQTRASIHEPQVASTLSSGDSELLEVFGFFYYPRFKHGPQQQQQGKFSTATESTSEASKIPYVLHWRSLEQEMAFVEAEEPDLSATSDQPSDWLDLKSVYNLHTNYF